MRNVRWLIVLLAAVGFASAQVPLTIATGGTGGVYYPVGGGYAQIIDQFIRGYTATVEVTGASVDNVAFISRGEADFALALADTVLAAYRGTGRFGPGGNLPQLPNLRAITVAYSNAVHILTLEGSGINSIRDLAGKRVSVGSPGSGTEVSARTMLEAVGITYNDFQVERLGAAETADALRDGAIDAGFWSGGVPTGAVLSLAETRQIKIVPISDLEFEFINSVEPTLIRFTFPAGAYRGIAETPSVGTPNLLIVAKEMDEQLAYDFTMQLFANIGIVRAIHPSGFETVPELALASPIPLHKGAIRALEEMGFRVPASLKVD